MPVVETGVPVITFIGTLGSDNNTNQFYPPSMMSYGHTFEFPDPFNNTLEPAFEGAAYMVEVHFADGSSDVGLIASPDLRGSTELRLYSFNVALIRKPASVHLYRFDTSSYPNLSSSSMKTLLDSRKVPSNPLENISQRTKVGRGWLGHSGDAKVSDFCFNTEDCADKRHEITWRGDDGFDLSFSPSVATDDYNPTASSLTFDAKDENGGTHQITVAASRYVGNTSWVPLIGASPSSEYLPPDASYGVAFWLPYELNTNLPPGKYTALALVSKGYKASSDFVNLRINLDLSIPEITETIDLSVGSFTSAPVKVESSSVYFLAKHPAIGPTKQVWWGGTRETLSVPMVSANCNNAEVIASIKAQNRCGNSLFQMNAGRGANDCLEHNLVLTLDGDDKNPWKNDYPGCKFETRAVAPVTIMAYPWHGPTSGNLLRTMHLAMIVELGP